MSGCFLLCVFRCSSLRASSLDLVNDYVTVVLRQYDIVLLQQLRPQHRQPANKRAPRRWPRARHRAADATPTEKRELNDRPRYPRRHFRLSGLTIHPLDNGGKVAQAKPASSEPTWLTWKSTPKPGSFAGLRAKICDPSRFSVFLLFSVSWDDFYPF